MVMTGSCPVAGRPRPRFFGVTDIAFLIILLYHGNYQTSITGQVMNFLRAYISKRQAGDFVYVAERSPKGNRDFLWSIAPLDIHKAEIRISPSAVPPAIRREAYKAL
jgi:hypothetical protein